MNIQPWIKDNKDTTFDIGFFATSIVLVRMEVKICNHPTFDVEIQVEGSSKSFWVAQPRLPADIGKKFIVDIVSADGTRSGKNSMESNNFNFF